MTLTRFARLGRYVTITQYTDDTSTAISDPIVRSGKWKGLDHRASRRWERGPRHPNQWEARRHIDRTAYPVAVLCGITTKNLLWNISKSIRPSSMFCFQAT